MVTRWSIKEPVRFWILKLILHTGKKNFKKLIFIIFIDYKITCRRVREPDILNGINTLGTWRICDFSYKILFAFFSSLSIYFFSLFFHNLFYFGLAWFLISALSLRYFSTSCSTLWNSVGEISPSCIACEMILVMLSNLL